MSTSYHKRATGFVRNAIKQRRNMIKHDVSRKVGAEEAILRIENGLARANDSASAARLIQNMEPQIAHILPTAKSKGLNKWQEEFYILLEEGKHLLKTQ
jgi:hypothetical protein